MDRTERDLALLSDPAFRRFAVEVVVLLIATMGLFLFVVGPWLHGALPGLFSRPPGTLDRGELPRTALGWLNWLVAFAVTGAFAYWRVTRTELGGEAWARARAISDPTVDRGDGTGDDRS